MIREEKSKWFPRIEGTRLSDKAKVNTVDVLRNKVSIVTINNSKISEEHTKSFYEETFKMHASHPLFQLVQVSCSVSLLEHRY